MASERGYTGALRQINVRAPRRACYHVSMLRVFAPLALLVLTACAAPPVAEPPAAPGAVVDAAGTPANGLAYAEQACGSCHAVGAGETWSPNPSAPPFEAIANTPGITRAALSAWLYSPHQNMPDLIVEHDRVDDLAAYLETLKRP